MPIVARGEGEDGRTSVSIRHSNHPDALVIDVANSRSIGRAFVQFGPRRIIESEDVESLNDAILKAARRWFDENWPPRKPPIQGDA